MKTEEEIQDLYRALVALEDTPVWFIDKADATTVRNTLTWILGD